jgi:nitrogen fixation NifU-like protein
LERENNMLENIYSKKVMEHFMHPKNMGTIKNPDGVATVGNPSCGDIARYYLKVEQKNGKEYIKDIKVETLGCGAAIATSSMATELIKGKSIDQALKLTNKAIAEALHGLPPVKMHCSILAEEGIKKAIENYKKKKKGA